MKTPFRLFSIVGIVAVSLNACGLFADDEPEPSGPDVHSFTFIPEQIEVFPGTCREVFFELRAYSFTGIDALELTIDEGSMHVETLGELSEGTTPGDYSGSWRVCHKRVAPAEGSIRVQFKDQPDLFVEARLTPLIGEEPLDTSGDPILSLPVASTFLGELRWSEDRATLKLVTSTGAVLSVDPGTGLILESRQVPSGRTTLPAEGLAWSMDNFGRALLIDLNENYLLSTVALHNFRPWTSPGNISGVHGSAGVMAVLGYSGGNCFVSVMNTQTGRMVELEYGSYSSSAPLSGLQHVVVSPNGWMVGWTGSTGCINTVELSAVYNTILDTKCAIDGNGFQRIKSKPVFSNDSEWIAHWTTPESTNDGYPIVVWNTSACGRRAYLGSLAHNASRGGLAVSSGGHRLAVTSDDNLRLYEVPEGINQTPRQIEAFAPIEAEAPNSDIQYFPALIFSDDTRQLVSASSRGVRIFNLEDGSVVETPRLDPQSVEISQDFMRVGLMDGESGGDLVYNLSDRPRFHMRLPDGSEYLGMDSSGHLFYRHETKVHRHNLRTGGVDEGNDEMTRLPPPQSSTYRVEGTNEGISVWR